MLEGAAEILQAMATVTHLRGKIGINSYVLEGSKQYYQMDFCTGLFLLGDLSTGILLTIAGPERDIQTEYREILGLTIPDRILAFNMPDIPACSDPLERALAASELPSVLLTRGMHETGEQSTILWAVQGVNPQTALDKLKRSIEFTIHRQN